MNYISVQIVDVFKFKCNEVNVKFKCSKNIIKHESLRKRLIKGATRLHHGKCMNWDIKAWLSFFQSVSPKLYGSAVGH